MGYLYLARSHPQQYVEGGESELAKAKSLLSASLGRILMAVRTQRAKEVFDFLGRSEAFSKFEAELHLVANNDSFPVLLTGERGTGKEVAARALHFMGPRWKGPFVPVLLSALAPDLICDELFGHEASAFTGASRRRLGKFKTAENGTIFLDEVADLPPTGQTALLRVVESGEIPRIGSDAQVRSNARIVAATNKNLPELVRAGKFRADLYDRLNVLGLRVPSLAERKSDIVLLAAAFLKNECRRTDRRLGLSGTAICEGCGDGLEVPCVNQALLDRLSVQEWPGNVRELRNWIHRVLALHPERILGTNDLPANNGCHPWPQDQVGEHPPVRLYDIITRHIRTTLRHNRFNQSKTARDLGLPLSTLRNKMQKLGIDIHKETAAPYRRPE